MPFSGVLWINGSACGWHRSIASWETEELPNRLSCAEFLKAFPHGNSTIAHRKSRAQFLFFTYQAPSDYAQPWNNNRMTIFFYCFCITLMFLVLWSVSIVLRERVHQIKRLAQMPCSDCDFFTCGYRVKCTVRPCCLYLASDRLHGLWT